MKKLRIYPYKMSSRSARKLADALNVRRVWPNRRYRPRASHVVLNWGSTQLPDWYDNVDTWINHPYGVQAAVDKISCMLELDAQGVSVPEYTQCYATAERWLTEGHPVIERHVLNGHSGKGIKIKYPGQRLEGAHFYTKYVGSRREYRCHIFSGNLIFLQQKKRRNGAEQNDTIRNHSGGWVYSHQDITPLSEEAIADAIKSVDALGLTFGGVDVITRRGKHYILEINTASGLGGPRSVEMYKNAISSYIARL